MAARPAVAAAVVAALVGAVTSVACGHARPLAAPDERYGSTAVLPAGDRPVSSTSAPPPRRTDVDVSTSPAAPTAGRPTSAAGTQSRPANTTTRQDPSGLFLTLVSNGATTFRRDQRIAFELIFENRSSDTIVYDSNQDLRFAIYERRDGAYTAAWDNTQCRMSLGQLDEEKPVTGVLELAPGERGNFIDEYPAPETSDHASGPDPRDCELPAGAYVVVGFVDWCPKSAIKESPYNGQRYCDSTLVTKVQSAPLAITLT